MKAHLIDSDEPLREGITYTALCGAVVRDATFVFFFNDDATNFRESLNTLNTCRHCIDLEIEKRYVYGILPAEHATEPVELIETMAA
jgi:hypothetical protein